VELQQRSLYGDCDLPALLGLLDQLIILCKLLLVKLDELVSVRDLFVPLSNRGVEAGEGSGEGVEDLGQSVADDGETGGFALRVKTERLKLLAN
jgi:hypothetical protein